MKTQVNGFIGGNLTRLREARGLSQADLSRLIGKTRAAISQYENGDNAPSIATLSLLSEKLNIPASRFLAFLPKPHSAPVFFRSMSATTKAARASALRRFEWLTEIVAYLGGYINFPKVNFPNFDLGDNFRKFDDDLIEDVATQVRRFWGLGDGAISNVVWLLENNGAVVSRFDLEAKGLDAFSTSGVTDQTPYLILAADKNVCARSRFDAAHELGHLILHRNLDRSRIAHTQDFSLIEKQAHRFAGAFLFPAKSYLSEIFTPSLDTFLLLKTKWQVSVQLMIKRGHDLGVITDDQAVRLWKNCNRRGWKYEEPYDNSLLPEKPRLLSRMFGMIVSENVRSRSDILADLQLPARDIQELAGLAGDFFEEKFEDVVSFKDFVKTRSNESTATDTPQGNRAAQILEFTSLKNRIK